jgi:hypothetical protein
MGKFERDLATVYDVAQRARVLSFHPFTVSPRKPRWYAQQPGLLKHEEDCICVLIMFAVSRLDLFRNFLASVTSLSCISSNFQKELDQFESVRICEVVAAFQLRA